MKKQFRRAGALMLALLMLMTAAPALAEDAPSAADGTQIEEIIGEEPAVTEAPTAIPTEALRIISRSLSPSPTVIISSPKQFSFSAAFRIPDHLSVPRGRNSV